eukprot:s57_g35.t1
MSTKVGKAKGAETWVSAVALRRSWGQVALRRCDAATLSGSVDAVTLRRCDAATGAVDAATLQRCDVATLRRCDVSTLRRCDAAALRRCRPPSDAATLLALRRCDAVVRPVTLGRCWRCGAARPERRCDAVGAATLRRCRARATL